MALTVHPHALDDARRWVIEEACPGFEREEKGPNGVLSPREVRGRPSMGETDEEIDADIKVLRQRQAERWRRDADAMREARERALRDSDAAQQAAPALCARMIQEHKEGHWFASQATATRLLTDDASASRKLDLVVVANVTRFIDRLGHNYSKPDQRELVLSARSNEAFMQFGALTATLDTIAGSIRQRAQRAASYEQIGRTAPGFVQGGAARERLCVQVFP